MLLRYRMAMSKPTLHVIVLAAGAGTRMRSAHAKVMLPLAGKPMLAHVLGAARALHPEKIHIVYGHRGDQLRAAFGDDADIAWAEQTEQRGTGHAVKCALDEISDVDASARVLVLYGDVPLIRAATLESLLNCAGELAVLTAILAEPHGYGRVVLDAAGAVLAIIEEKDCSAAQSSIATINTGIVAANAVALRSWLAQLTDVNAQNEFLLTDVFALAAAQRTPALAVACDDAREILGANDAWQLAELEASFRERAARSLCAQGVRLADPLRIDIRGDVVAASDVAIDVDVILEGCVRLGSDVRIGPFTRIANATLAPGTEVRSHCDIDGIVTHGPCVIGPFARLRPGTEISTGSHIGNFVEVKNATIGINSKISHLSYIGDAKIGAAVNIGAGVITCNYDGANKHRTTIENGAFVGSNSALVAPVRIGKDATIGAGSVIARDAAPGELTVSRARQVTLPGWQRPVKKTEP